MNSARIGFLPVALLVLLFLYRSFGVSVGADLIGKGTAGEPFRISSCEQLQAIRENLSAHYVLNNDIDCSETQRWNKTSCPRFASEQMCNARETGCVWLERGACRDEMYDGCAFNEVDCREWCGGSAWTGAASCEDVYGFEPIGSPSAPFTGVLDGAGFRVSGLAFHRPGQDDVGLIGYARGGLVKNLHLEGTTISAARYYAGALVGRSVMSWIMESSSKGTNVVGRHALGCLVGASEAAGGSGGIVRSIVSNCSLEGGAVVGSLLGESIGGTLREVAASGGIVRGAYGVGGLVGEGRGSKSAEAFSSVRVEGTARTAGLVGMLEKGSVLSHALSLGRVKCAQCTKSDSGGLLGVLDETSIVLDGFYKRFGASREGAKKGVPLSSRALGEKNTYKNWNFETIWFQEGTGNPFLRAFVKEEKKKAEGEEKQKPPKGAAQEERVLSGTVFDRDGDTPLKNQVTVAVSINGGIVAARAKSDKKGAYRLRNIEVGSGDLLTLFLEGAETGALTITRVTGTGAPLSDIHLGRLMVQSAGTGAPLGSRELAQAVAHGGFSHPDLEGRVEIEGGNVRIHPSLELSIPRGSALALEGDLSAGDVFLEGAMIQKNGAVVISGDFVLAGGRYQAGKGMSRFERNVIMEGGSFEGSSGDVIFNYDLVGVFSFLDGTFTAPRRLFVRSDWMQEGGKFEHNKSKVIFDGTSHQLDVQDSVSFYDVQVSKKNRTGLDMDSADTLIAEGTMELIDGDVSGGTVIAKGDIIHRDTFDGGSATFVIAGKNKKVVLSADGGIPRLRLDAKGTSVRIRRAQEEEAQGRHPAKFPEAFRVDEGEVILSDGEEWLFTELELRGGNVHVNGGSLIVEDTFQMLGGTIQANRGLMTFHAPFVQSGGTVLMRGAQLTAHAGILLKSGLFRGGYGLIDINDDFEMRGGSFIAPSSTMTFGGNVKKKGGVFEHNGGTVIFDGRSKELDMDDVTLMHVEVSKAGGSHLVLKEKSRVYVDGNLSFTEGTTTEGTFVVSGNVTMGPGYATGSTALHFTGPQAQEWDMEYPERFQGNIIVNKSTGAPLVLQSDLSLRVKDQELVIAHGVLDLNERSILFQEKRQPSVVVEGGALLLLRGGEELPDIDIREHARVRYELKRGLQRLPQWTYYHLVLDAPKNSKFLLPDGGLTVGGDLVLGGGRLHADKNQEIRISGSWRQRGGSFFPGNGSVTFNGPEQYIEGDNMFYNFTKRMTGNRKSVLVIEAGSKQRVNNQLTLTGNDCDLLKLRSSRRGEQWMLEVIGSAKMKSVDIEDGRYLSRLPFLCAQECIDRGNNEHIEFRSEVCEKSKAYCGNGIPEKPSEQCDDGNLVSGDGCSPRCKVEDGFVCKKEPSVCATTCGDRLVLSGEECDDGNTESGDGCSPKCAIEKGFDCSALPSVCEPTCGDRLIVGGEECDDGNTVSADGCSPACQAEQWYICTKEAPRSCSLACGNGVIGDDETCDDGNRVGYDGCSAYCTVEDGFVCKGEPSKCAAECGDGFIRGGEVCDDGNKGSKDGCSNECVPEKDYHCEGEPSTCMRAKPAAPADALQGAVGNGAKEEPSVAPEQPKPPKTVPRLILIFPEQESTKGTGPSLEAPQTEQPCGNGRLDGGEECDDRNTDDGDGCDRACKVELGR